MKSIKRLKIINENVLLWTLVDQNQQSAQILTNSGSFSLGLKQLRFCVSPLHTWILQQKLKIYFHLKRLSWITEQQFNLFFPPYLS